MAGATSTNYLHNAILGEILRGSAWTPPTTLYVALFTNGSPALDGTGATEVVISSATNYARVAIPCNTSNWSAPSGTNQEYSNLNEIVFPVPATQSWGTITSCALFDSATGGNMLWVGRIGTSKPVSTGDGAPRILAGQLKISRATC